VKEMVHTVHMTIYCAIRLAGW